MADRDCKDPEIKILRPSGIDLRSGRNAIADQHGDRIHGLWPKQTGLLQRFPGHTLMRQVGDKVYQLCQTFDGSGNILCQIGDTVQAFTLDELKNIQSDVDIEASVGNEEDQVGMAVIVQTEANNTSGGSIDGYLTGSSSASADTFYGRRLTNMWVNETVSTLQTVSSFTASTGGSGAASTAGQFVLVPGTYRIEISIVCMPTALSDSVVIGLYNATSAAFETYAGTTQPILAVVRAVGTQFPGNDQLVKITAAVTVSSSNKTFEIRQKAGTTTSARDNTLGGINTGMTTANVNGAASKNTYCTITIWRFT